MLLINFIILLLTFLLFIRLLLFFQPKHTKKDEKTCNRQPDNLLFFSRRNDIRWLCIDCDSKQSIVQQNDETASDVADAVLSLQKMQSAVAIDMDFESRSIFWSDITADTISRALWNGTGQTVVVAQPLESPAGVAIDWIGRNLYWTDSGN
jgi:hypothetical protein